VVASESVPIRKATRGDVPALARTLARAFASDPGARWFFPDADCRERQLQRWFDASLRRLYLRHGECYTTEGIQGGALWVPPHGSHLGLRQAVRLLPLGISLFGHRLPRIAAALTAGSPAPSGPHYYLPFMGVAPECQGQGIGSSLMQPVLRGCDETRCIAYLEATTPENLRLYQRHAFVVAREYRLARQGPPLWAMERAPRTA